MRANVYECGNADCAWAAERRADPRYRARWAVIDPASVSFPSGATTPTDPDTRSAAQRKRDAEADGGKCPGCGRKGKRVSGDEFVTFDFTGTPPIADGTQEPSGMEVV